MLNGMQGIQQNLGSDGSGLFSESRQQERNLFQAPANLNGIDQEMKDNLEGTGDLAAVIAADGEPSKLADIIKA